MVDHGSRSVVDAERGTVRRVDGGWLSSWFLTDPDRRTCVLDDPYVLVHEGTWTGAGEPLPLFDRVAREGRPLLLVAEDMLGEALAALVVSHLRGRLRVAAVGCRAGALADLAVWTGATLLSGADRPLASSDLGVARRVVVARDHTLVVGASDGRRVNARAERP